MWLGPFELVESIARGGMAEVFRARMPGESVDVALKVMTGELAQSDYYREQFRREVQAMAKLSHPAIATIYDLGEVGSGEANATDGRLPKGGPWLAMEYVAGESLGEYLEGCEWEVVEEVVLQLLDSLAHAHAQDIIHRDLKPSNVLVESRDGASNRAKLVDFGVARIVSPDEEAELAERERRVTGTPSYMAPEQILGRRRDQGPWTDLYALGCLVWRLVCGETPYSDPDSEVILEGHIEQELPRFEPIMRIPDGLDAWLRRMLRKRPRARFRRAADAAYGLVELSRGGSVGGSHADGGTEWAVDEEGPTTLLALEETFRELEAPTTTAETLDPAESDPFDVAPLAAEERDWESPPVPVSWRRRQASDQEFLRGAGLNLFGLRKLPVVDRESERDRLWGALREVTDANTPRAVVIDGSTGCGKSRLAEWLAERAHETGAANVLQAHCSPTEGRGPREGLGPMLARYFRTFGLEHAQIRELLERQFERLGVGGPSVYHDAAGLARIMSRADAGEGVPREPFEDASARQAALVRILRVIGHERTALLVFDDAQWAGESLEFVADLLEVDYASLPVLVVMTLAGDQNEIPDEHRKLVERIREARATERMQVGSLGADDLQRLALRLGLDRSLARDVARRSDGNPLFAIQLINDWIERGLLTRTSGGFDLRDSGEASVPDDMSDLWELRLERLLASLPDKMVDDCQLRLELAATLGDTVRHEEWVQVCERRGVPVPDESPMLDTMYRRGLAERTREGGTFAHEMLRQRVLERAEHEDRLIAHHAVCAKTLVSTYSTQALGVPLRIARHLLAAGESAEAIPYLDRAVWQALDAGRVERARRLLERHGESIDRLDGEHRVRTRLRHRILRAELLVNDGRGKEAENCIEPAIEEAEERSWDYELASALRVRVMYTVNRGKSERALRDCLRALDRIDWQEHPIETGQLYRALGRIERDRGKPEKAREAYRKAADWFETGGFFSHQADQLSSVGYTWLMEGELDRAAEALERALELAKMSGNRSVEASTRNFLGELSRRRSELEEAREQYQAAREIYQSIGDEPHIPQANLALVELAAANWQRARELLVPVIEKLPEVGLELWVPSLRLGLACVDIAQSRLGEGRQRAELAEDELAEVKTANPDTAWLGELLGDLASNAGDMKAAQIGWAVARDQWRRLENFDMAEKFDQRLPSSETSRAS